MLVVVSDTSPLRCLAHLGQLRLIEGLFAEVVIPPAVANELRNRARGDISHEVLSLTCVRVQSPMDRTLLGDLRLLLDPGEAEAIALACELHADLVLMDEKRGRAECVRRGMPAMGVLGLLARAKLRGLIPAVAPLMNSLVQSGGFFVDETLRKRILSLCGEDQ